MERNIHKLAVVLERKAQEAVALELKILQWKSTEQSRPETAHNANAKAS